MANKEFICPYCKHQFYAEEHEQVVCPECGKLVKRDTTEPIF
jgi:uncharacterized Zn-finger protein